MAPGVSGIVFLRPYESGLQALSFDERMDDSSGIGMLCRCGLTPRNLVQDRCDLLRMRDHRRMGGVDLAGFEAGQE